MKQIWMWSIMVLTLNQMGCNRKAPADLVLKNGKVYTVDEKMQKAQAVAISGGKIVSVGSDDEIDAYIGRGTKVVNVQGKAVMPGFIDSHYHFMGVGEREYYLNLDGTKSMGEFLTRVKSEVDRKAPGEWILGRGWIEEDWPSKRFPTCRDLDRVAPRNPVILTRADGHAIVVNSAAMKLAGINRSTPDPQGGAILKDKRGNCNGLFLDKAMSLVRRHVPPDTSQSVKQKYAIAAQKVAFGYGITQVHDMGTNWHTVDLWKKMYADDRLKIRIYAFIRGPGDDSKRLLLSGAENGLFKDRLTVRGIKITQDGALGSRGAALLDPYSDADTRGLLIYEDEEIYPTIKTALKEGIQMAIHAIGDAANRNVLDLYEKALLEVPLADRKVAQPRFRIEHAQIVHLDDIPRFKLLNIIPSMQPSHAIGDLHFAVRRLGLDRMEEGYAWRKFLDDGGIIPAGSDAPVEEGNPMIEFYAAVTREDTAGFSADGWHPEYKMTREEALKSLTIWGARAAFMEDLIGSIEPGKYADLVVLDKDPMTESTDRLFEIKVMQTYLAGVLVYQREEMMSALYDSNKG